MAKRKKDELAVQLEAAKASGAYMVAVWKVTDGKLDLFRLTEGFPLADVAVALTMLKDDLAPLTIREPEASA